MVIVDQRSLGWTGLCSVFCIEINLAVVWRISFSLEKVRIPRVENAVQCLNVGNSNRNVGGRWKVTD